MTGSCDYAILYGSFESTLCIGVNLITDRTHVIFLATRGETGCSDCFCLYKIVGANKLIYNSVFVALFVANGTFLVLNTFGVKSGLRVNYPLIIVDDLTGSATAVVTVDVAGIRPSVAGCRGFAIDINVTTYATGVRGVTVSLTGGSRYYTFAVGVCESRNYTIRLGHFNSTVFIGEKLAATRTNVIFFTTRGSAGRFGCCYLCELMRTNLGKSYFNKQRITGILFS